MGSARGARRVFISATSNGFTEYRGIATQIVAAQGLIPVVQEHFPTPHEEVIKELRKKMYACNAMLGIVGQFFGAAPPVAVSGETPVSYTQFEMMFAINNQLPCLAMIAQENCEDVTAPPESDSLRELQRGFIASLKVVRGRPFAWTEFGNRYEFALRLAKLCWEDWLDGR